MDLSSRFDSALACVDPECHDDEGRPGRAEPEEDGDHRYHECGACGRVFGFERIQKDLVAVSRNGSCSVGIPEDVRRKASAGMLGALAAQDALPLLTIGRRRDAAP